jgi:hypothetical protein
MMKTRLRPKTLPSSELIWSHLGSLHRVTPWPELAFARQEDGRWIPYEPDPADAVFASAAVVLDERKWADFLDFVPAREREFAAEFKYGRLAALVVLHRCPALLDDLAGTPALLPFVAAHAALRGADEPRWPEINAVHERGGLFACLEWLGLPASRQTLTVLRKVAQPDLARRLLEPLRSALWEPETIWVLEHATSLSDRQLTHRCQALAA